METVREGIGKPTHKLLKTQYSILRQNVKELSEEFQKIIIDAAKRQVGKTKPGNLSSFRHLQEK